MEITDKPGKAARARQEDFRTVADLMPELISFIDAEQRYQFTNKSYEQWFSLPQEDFKGRLVREILGEDVYATVRTYIEKALTGESTSFEGYISSQGKLGRRYLHADYVPHILEPGKIDGIYVITRDMTRLKEAEEKCHTFLETVPDAMVIADSKAKINVVNVQAERMFGYSRQELIGQPVEILIAKRFRESHLSEWATMNGPAARPIGVLRELYAVRKDGSEFPVEINVSPIETAEGIFVSSAIRDVTERRQLAEQIRWATVLEERGRMARDIHDGLAQGFTGIILNLESIEETCAELGFPEEVKKRLALVRNVARQSLEQTRQSVLTLSLTPSADCDLTSCIRTMVNRDRSVGTKTRVEFFVRGTPVRLDPIAEENLCHIAQQATDNALLHARASTIRIALAFEKQQVRLQVRDDGHGFDTRKVRHGMGISGMRERARAVGGTFKLGSTPGKGTSVRVRFALPVPTLPAASR